MLPIMLISMRPAPLPTCMTGASWHAVAVDSRWIARPRIGAGVARPVTRPSCLTFCFIVGSGMALFGPAWQSSVSEQVPSETLPSAVALNGISYNIARSFGPAIGGIVVATAGAVAAFAPMPRSISAAGVLFLWRRTSEPSRLPRERLNRAIVSGVRYIAIRRRSHRAGANARRPACRRVGVGADALVARDLCMRRATTVSCSAHSAWAR